MDYWCLLPKEIYKEIFSYCKYDRFTFQFVNKEWNKIVKEMEIYSPWELITHCLNNGQFNVLEWLMEKKKYKIDDPFCWALTDYPNIDSLNWLKQRGYSWYGDEWEFATLTTYKIDGKLDFYESREKALNWLLKEGCLKPKNLVYNIIWQQGSYELVAWLLDNDFPIYYSIMDDLQNYIGYVWFIVKNKLEENILKGIECEELFT